ncbi:hypothetical protein D0469_09080 [Peribacillus saganii]|uniref:Uncharacterized protein n=1 Tax=Peribacillus saganii TaxID=2303992 RepID=A0A372LQB1_9BACI|nr:hypothetical protein [Peribacillus saganii]RFU69508.1 hypothetical protein D0469_09080 [Peribacillus saganii]
METIEIWKMENETGILILKGKPSPDVFWVELYQENLLVEKSTEIHDWDDQMAGLMEKYDWQTYETYFVHPLFTRLVSNFRRLNGHYIKPNPRERILELYDRFLNCDEVAVKKTAYEFCVGPEEIKEDIRILRNHLKSHEKEINYIRSHNVYKLKS